MESGLEWRHGDSQNSPTWDIPSLSVGTASLPSSLEAVGSRSIPWGLGAGDLSGTSAWSTPAAAGNMISRATTDVIPGFGCARPNENGGNDPWKTGNWNQPTSNGRANNLGATGWGKVPVCQGSAWDASANLKESVRLAPEPELVLNGSNDGTDIWRVNLSKSNVPLTPVGSAPGGNRSCSSINDMPWANRDLQSLEGLRQSFLSGSMPVQTPKPAWDSNGAGMWGVTAAESQPVAPMSAGMQNSNRYFAMRRSPSLSTGSWNAPDLGEADYGQWSQSSAAAVSAPAPQKIDNGTAVWGAPPVLPDAFGSTNRVAVEPPTLPVPVNALPFLSIDFSVPPPPVYKMSTAPGGSGLSPTYWNNVQQGKTVGNWSGMHPDGSRTPASVTAGIDWVADNGFNRKGVSSSNLHSQPKLHSQPQMRSRLLQQLMDAGFRKEDAQNAIIRNDMNYERALADLISNSTRMNSNNDFQAPLGDCRIHQSFHGLDNSFTPAVTIPSNVYPPIVPQMCRDAQSKLLPNMHGSNSNPLSSNDIRTDDLKSKDPNYLQHILNSLLLQSIQQGALSQQMLPMANKQLSSRQVVTLQRIVELQQLLMKLQETVPQTVGEKKNQIEGIIQQVQIEIFNLQMKFMEKKPTSNGSSPVDAVFLGHLQNLGLKSNEQHSGQTADSCPPSIISNMTPDFMSCPLTSAAVSAATWSSITSPLSSAGDFTDPTITNARMMTSLCVGGQSSAQEQSGTAAAAALNIKEFIPGRPWVDDGTAPGKSSNDNWKAPGWGALDGSSGGLQRRGSLTMGKRLDGSTAVGSLSSSDWSLDVTANSASSLRNDLTMSVPTVWSPVDGKSSDSGSSSSGFRTSSCKSSYQSQSVASDSSAKTNGSDVVSELGTTTLGNDQTDNPAMKMLCNGWGGGSYEHGWSLGDDDGALLPGDLLTDP